VQIASCNSAPLLNSRRPFDGRNVTLTVPGFQVYYPLVDNVSAVSDDVANNRPDLQRLGGYLFASHGKRVLQYVTALALADKKIPGSQPPPTGT